MLKKLLMIMWHDRRTGMLRIVRKSYARYRRFGYRDMRRKLEREYYALYPGEIRRGEGRRRYRQWRNRHERNLLRRPIPLSKIRFTILYRPKRASDMNHLRGALQSVRRQTYGNWELLVGVESDCPETILRILKRLAREDRRIRLLHGSREELPSQFLREMTGAYVLCLPPDDRLAPHALAAFASALERDPRPELLYADEDFLDARGMRHTPHFKTEWNPDLFYSCNYLGNAWCLERSRFVEAWKDERYPRGRRLLLNALKRMDGSRIHHIPQVLFHHRDLHEDACATYCDEGDEEAIAALRDHFSEAEGIRIERGLLPGSTRVIFPLPEPEPMVTIIIPTRDQYGLLHQCIGSILEKTRYSSYEIVVVDNQSEDPKTLEYLERLETEYRHIRVLKYDRPFNYSAINNYAARKAKGEVLALLNNDVEIISEGWLTEMVRHAMREEIGAVGAKLYYDNLTVQHAGVILGLGEVAGHGHKYFARESDGYFGRLKLVQNYSAVTGACLVVRKDRYEEVGGLEERHLTVAFNDVDFCLKLLEKGYRNLWTPYAELFHHESRSRGVDNTPEKQARFEREVDYMLHRWGDLLARDPYYSPHLSSFFEDFRIETYWKERKKLRHKGRRRHIRGMDRQGENDIIIKIK